MADQRAEAKRRRIEATALALAAVLTAARTEALARAGAGRVRDALGWVWRDRLQQVIRAEALGTVREIGPLAAEVFDLPYWTPNRAAAAAEKYLDVMAREMSGAWEQLTREALAQIDLAAPDLEAEVKAALSTGENLAGMDGQNVTEAAANLAEHDVATEVGKTTKTWHLGTGEDHRPSHVAQDGMTVGIDERFPNGQRFPGSPAPPSERLNCHCGLTYGG